MRGAADAGRLPRTDHVDMKLADRSPAAVLLLAHVVVFGVVGVEIAMWATANAVFVAATLVLAAVVAVGVLRWFFSLLDEEDTTAAVEAAPAASPAPAVVVVAAEPRRTAAPSRPAATARLA